MGACGSTISDEELYKEKELKRQNMLNAVETRLKNQNYKKTTTKNKSFEQIQRINNQTSTNEQIRNNDNGYGTWKISTR